MSEKSKQISLFDILEETPKEINKVGKPVVTGTIEPQNLECPAFLKDISKSKNLEEFVRAAAKVANCAEEQPMLARKVYNHRAGRIMYDIGLIRGNNVFLINSSDNADEFVFRFDDWKLYSNLLLLFVDENGIAWSNEVDINYESIYHSAGYGSDKPWVICNSLHFNKWKVYTKCPNLKRTILLNQNDSLWTILKKTNPYAYDFAKEKWMKHPVLLFTSPQLEQLSKAGFDFADRACTGRLEEKELDCLNRLIQPGKNLKTIFKTSKDVYNVLKDETDLEIWDVYRRMAKTGKLSKDTIQQAYWRNFRNKELTDINAILGYKHEGKNVFTWNSLMNYLQRLDTFQAIDYREAFPLLRDYLRMCSDLEIMPRIDSDSLKREHDVAARTVRERRNEIMENKMKNACDYLKVNDYTEKTFFIRGIRDYKDLIDEARQQRNCVGGYGSSIIARRSLIYVMRETDHPESSLITVELNPDMNQIRQKYLACNQPIRNKAQTEFLERWLELVKKRKQTGAESIMKMLESRNRVDEKVKETYFIPKSIKDFARNLAAKLDEFSKATDPYGYQDNYDENIDPVDQIYGCLIKNGKELQLAEDDLKLTINENEEYRDEGTLLVDDIELFKTMYKQVIKDQSDNREMAAYQLADGKYLKVQLNEDDDWEYDIYNSDFSEYDGGILEDEAIMSLAHAVCEVMEFNGLNELYPAEVDYDDLEEKVQDKWQQKAAMIR